MIKGHSLHSYLILLSGAVKIFKTFKNGLEIMEFVEVRIIYFKFYEIH